MRLKGMLFTSKGAAANTRPRRAMGTRWALVLPAALALICVPCFYRLAIRQRDLERVGYREVLALWPVGSGGGIQLDQELLSTDLDSFEIADAFVWYAAQSQVVDYRPSIGLRVATGSGFDISIMEASYDHSLHMEATFDKLYSVGRWSEKSGVQSIVTTMMSSTTMKDWIDELVPVSRWALLTMSEEEFSRHLIRIAWIGFVVHQAEDIVIATSQSGDWAIITYRYGVGYYIYMGCGNPSIVCIAALGQDVKNIDTDLLLKHLRFRCIEHR